MSGKRRAACKTRGAEFAANEESREDCFVALVASYWLLVMGFGMGKQKHAGRDGGGVDLVIDDDLDDAITGLSEDFETPEAYMERGRKQRAIVLTREEMR